MIGALALFVAAGLAVVGQRALTDPRIPLDAWVWFGGAAVLAVYALTRLPDKEPTEPMPPTRLPGRPIRIVSMLIMVLAVVANGWALSRLLRSGVDRLGLTGWAVSLGALAIGGWLFGALQKRLDNNNPASEVVAKQEPLKPAGSEPTVPQVQSEPVLSSAPSPASDANNVPVETPVRIPVWLELTLVVAIAVLAIYLRVHRLEQMPPGIFVDETNAALDAIAIMEGRRDSPFGTGWFETPTMYAYYLVGLFKVLGTTFVSLKVASLLPGILTVLLLYPLARLMFGIPTALVATFLLAVSRWHFNMSRWGWNEVAPPLFQLGATYFLLRGARSRQMRDFAIGGILLGLGMYTYLASRLVVAVILAYLVYRIVVERGFLRKAWAGLIVFWLAYMMTFAPLASTYIRNPFTFLNRSRQVSIFNDVERAGGSYAPLWENTKRHLLMFHVRGDNNPRHNL
ncbi:MAG: glycosyltransferase family 39 protein, partial [Anaerolineae bacterium]|nr:glycosyltransferase family 39 protein [Anaerolineae bacterium]